MFIFLAAYLSGTHLGVTKVLRCIPCPSGNAYCYPKFQAAVIEKPSFTCDGQYFLNHTKLGTACVKHTLAKTTSCFRSLHCPEFGNYTQTEDVW